ncbi:hypothetical protein G1C98_0026 [Bifidobacterium sp. DSM 109960]|uniref:Uncharacterized protein n=1 Tax=Bifidobacterium erythrocebi TaxID=2675325 RepID=A0A7Y0ERX1_9BIFI|nr:hypothetical protein [Bifidobacterium sp. DSM 109960]
MACLNSGKILKYSQNYFLSKKFCKNVKLGKIKGNTSSYKRRSFSWILPN